MAKQFGGDQVAWNCGAVNTHKSAQGAVRPLVDGSGDKFFARPCFTGDQNGGICGSNFGYTRENRVQGRRNPHDLLKHRCPIDFFAQRNVLVLKSLLSLLAILDIGRCGIPTCGASLFIQRRIVADEKPAVPPVSSPQPHFHIVRGPAQELAINFRYAFPILWMKQPVRVGGLPLLKSQTVIIERGLVVIKTLSVWSQYGDVLRRKIKELSELLFALPDLLFRPLALGDVADEASKLSATVNRDLSEGDLDRELLTVLAKSD